jgi:ABC-type dipeptide/oligopeptide/nickel transport system permease subunit
VIQFIVLLVVVGVTAAMCSGNVSNTFLEVLMQNDIQLLFSLSGAALFIVLMSWLEEAVELVLYESGEDSQELRVDPFGFWWCLEPAVTLEEMEMHQSDRSQTTRILSALSPLLRSSVALMKADMHYDSMRT